MLKNFNSHPHKEDDVRFGLFSMITLYFNSHPHKEDDEMLSQTLQWLYYFNSHPHKEDDKDKISKATIAGISTHILTRRMTTVYTM